jgi:glutaminase
VVNAPLIDSFLLGIGIALNPAAVIAMILLLSTQYIRAEVYASASATTQRNRAVSQLLENFGRLYTCATATTGLSFRLCWLNVTAQALAVIGPTFANAGVNPVTGDRVVAPGRSKSTLAVMATAGLYDTSGDWLFDIGLPGQSGIGGTNITVAPSEGGFDLFAPPLNRTTTASRGNALHTFLGTVGAESFASQPVTRDASQP